MSAGLILGAITGLTYGLLAVGIVLIFKANRFINVAHAQLGTLSALLLGRFVLDDGWSWWVAFPTVIAVGVLAALVVERLVIRPMLKRRRHAVSLLLVSIGVAQLLLALTYIQGIGPNNTTLYQKGYPVPIHVEFDLGAFVLRGQHVLILTVVPLIVLALAGFLRYSIWGKMLRASASNGDAARLCGISVSRINAMAWGIAGGLSAVTAVLQAPGSNTFNTAALGPGLLLRALGAAALGGFTNIPLALLGGLVIAEAEHITLATRHNGGDAELVVLFVVIAILFVRGRAIAAGFSRADSRNEEVSPPRVPESVRTRPTTRYARPLFAVFCLLVALLAPVAPFFNTDAHRFQLIVTLVMAISGVALTMVVGWAGQVSLGHFALLGMGA